LSLFLIVRIHCFVFKKRSKSTNWVFIPPVGSFGITKDIENNTTVVAVYDQQNNWVHATNRPHQVISPVPWESSSTNCSLDCKTLSISCSNVSTNNWDTFMNGMVIGKSNSGTNRPHQVISPVPWVRLSYYHAIHEGISIVSWNITTRDRESFTVQWTVCTRCLFLIVRIHCFVFKKRSKSTNWVFIPPVGSFTCVISMSRESSPSKMWNWRNQEVPGSYARIPDTRCIKRTL
jgi:hypothetical protein